MRLCLCCLVLAQIYKLRLHLNQEIFYVFVRRKVFSLSKSPCFLLTLLMYHLKFYLTNIGPHPDRRIGSATKYRCKDMP